MNSEEHTHTNNLINETSPYLLQHAHNPVDWYAWGDEAFAKAKQENKLVLISIGYAACHWCHVMEHESFENEMIAKLMNEHYICIKVDREERPDVDKIYMDAVQMLTGSGGWPLNCFALPDGRPVYGGTYYNPQQWQNILIGLNTTYRQEPQKVLNTAEELTVGISKHHVITLNQTIDLPALTELEEGVHHWKQLFDEEWGGNNRAPKFPMPVGLSFLQEYSYYTDDADINKHLDITLQKMAHGGIYDQIGGGFSRYSVDAKWKVPHFEKMLYDNGQLLSLYSKAYETSMNPLYKNVITQTIDFHLTEMRSPDGAFYASFDADSEGVEGKFYVWKKEELQALLKNNEEWVFDYYSIKEHGNWEGENILWITERDEIIKKYGFNSDELDRKLKQINSRLLDERNKRIYPGLDNKVLSAWNALMGIGLLDAYKALNDNEYLNVAQDLAKFFESKLINEDGSLYRNYTNETTSIEAFNEDYALCIKFYIALYQTTFNEHYLSIAKRLMTYSIDNFYDKNSGMFYYTHKDAGGLINRSLDLSDNVIPSSNAVMAHNLLDLSILFSNKSYYNMSMQMLKNVVVQVKINIPYYANWASLWQRFMQPQYEVVFCGENADKQALEFNRKYMPNAFVAGTTKNGSLLPLNENRWVDGESLIYVCRNRVCKLPVKDVQSAIDLLK